MGSIEIRNAPKTLCVESIGQYCRESRRVIFDSRKTVGCREAQSRGSPPFHGNLQAVIFRLAGVLQQADHSKTLVRPEKIRIHARVCLQCSWSELADIAQA